MNAKETLEWLKARGSSTVARVYQRHGATAEPLGVTYADLKTLVKTLGTNPQLAKDLFATGVHEARIVAFEIADAGRTTAKDLEGWLESARDHVTIGALASFAAKVPEAPAIAAAWIERAGEWPTSAGWTLYGALAAQGRLGEAEAAKLLERIRKEIKAAPNRTRHAMNGALIAIGGSMESLRSAAEDVARAIGKVEVDHGDTDCVTPSAIPYMAKMWERSAKKKAPAKKKARAKKAAKKKA